MPIEHMMDKAGIPDSPDAGGETTSLPLSMVGGQPVAPGDVVRLEVVSVDEESGTFTAKYSTPDEPEVGGIDEMAAKMNEG